MTIPRGALIHAIEEAGFSPSDAQRVVDVVAEVLTERGCEHGPEQWIEGFCLDCEDAVADEILEASRKRWAEATSTDCPATARIEIAGET